ncbi:Aminopeptidase O [Araneus ventricosus]|uniref:Aminopeptidase O n=1 Tax=Araneus ventricosus TaxID=182803 RepID=A0A4Y2KNF3_ARAVE|nr:Aminopeptidase O [Araneus ventricosus]
MSECSLQEDLPLMSNVDDILVRHYNFDFQCHFNTKTFTCFAVLFLEPVVNKLNPPSNELGCSASEKHFKEVDQTDRGFVLILDCHKILVKEVIELQFSPELFMPFKFRPSSLTAGEYLCFEVIDWSLKIWKNNKTCKCCFPKVIRISYETIPSCPSVLWVNDQNGNPSVFSYGAFINNRALFPCQEPPVAMATWEAVVSITDPMVALMSGDEEPEVTHDKGFTHFYYSTKKVLPLSTLCLAIGTWQEYLVPLENKNGPKCRMFACSKLLDKAIQEFSHYIPQCLKASHELLGPYPFPRIDFLVVPPSFSSLGMASPNLVFLSQSLLAGDKSLCSRISHEVSHGWFGLSIGALDWTEEWLSEGFATFLEDVLHAKTAKMSPEDSKQYFELKALIRRKALLDEIENTQDDLQILRPSHGEDNKHVVDGVNVTVLKNGQNPIKGFIQVHYIKGCFLLKYLSNLIGMQPFMNFLKMYTIKYEGQLVTCKEFLAFFLSSFPSLNQSFSVEYIYENWLHNSGVTPFQNSNLSKAAFAKANSIPRMIFNNILAAKLCSSNAQICDQERKRQRFSPYENVDKALLSWIKYARSQNAPISWNILKEKSLEFANELGESSFVASNGWLQRFNSRHNLSFKKLCGEVADFDSSLKEWKDVVLRDILERYESANVFNVDECGLSYRILPDRTLCFKGEKCVGGKKSKERLTVLLAANMDGSEKIIPLVIGKCLKPRCMKNCKSLPLFYDANLKAWMTAGIWEKTLRRWDLNFSKQKRKVALIADNCTAYCTVDGLKSIELVFLPPNSTCVLQPLGQGIIQNFKATYRKLLLQDMISAIDRKEQLQVSV